jgi:thioredoxin-related protein
MNSRITIYFIVITMMLGFSAFNVEGYNIDHSYLDLQGNQLNINNFSGNYLFLEAFSTKCPVCVSSQQQSALSNLYQDTQSEAFDKKLNMLSLSVAIHPSYEDTLEEVKNFVASSTKDWHIGLDHTKSFHSKYNIDAIPIMILFNEEGFEVYRWRGYKSYSELSLTINSILEGSITVTPIDRNENQNTGGSGTSILGNFFGNRLVQLGIVMLVIVIIYFYSTGKKS